MKLDKLCLSVQSDLIKTELSRNKNEQKFQIYLIVKSYRPVNDDLLGYINHWVDHRSIDVVLLVLVMNLRTIKLSTSASKSSEDERGIL